MVDIPSPEIYPGRDFFADQNLLHHIKVGYGDIFPPALSAAEDDLTFS